MMPDVEAQRGLAGDDVASAGIGGDLADGGNQAIRLKRQRLDGKDQVRRGAQRIMAQADGNGPGVAGDTRESHLQA